MAKNLVTIPHKWHHQAATKKGIIGYLLGFGGLIDERIKEGGNQSELAKRIPRCPY